MTKRKSQLAIQHTYYVRSRMPLTYVFWVHASTRARFEEAYKGLADRLELPGRDDQTIDVLRLVSSWLCDEKNGQWTMVLDNVDNVENFFPSRKRKQDEAAKGLPAPLMAYLPQSPNGSILITSRNKDVAAKLTGGHHNLKEIPAMKESEGLQLLRNKLSEASYNEDTAVQLLRMLDHVPLIITQAAAYINRRARMTIGTYLKEFCANNKRREVLLSWDAGDLRRDESASNSVIVTWEISFERIRQDRRSAAELLSIMSYFNPQGIPERTLQGYNTLSAEIDAPGNKGEAECTFNEDLDTLHAYSLIMPTKTKVTGSVDVETWEMHPLVQFCTQLWLSSTGELERRRMSFVELLAQEFPNPRFDNRMECGQLFPHVAPLFDLEPNSEHLSKAWAQILTNTGKYLSMQGNYRMAQAVLDKAVKARGRVLGLNNDQTLRSVGILASALQHQGKYEEAEKLNWQVLKGRERGLGILHLETLTTVNNLALVLYHRGRYEEAEKLNRRALEGREKKLGEDHLDTLTSVNNLAIVLRYQGKYEESEKLNHRALDGRRKELGEHHPHTLTTLANLALVLKSEKKYEEAENLSRQALEGAAKELGTHHPETLTKMYNLAYLLHTMDQHDEAAQLYQQAHSGLVQVLGPQHPQTIVCNKNFASLKQKTKQGSL
jgi:tetratricopeptide (TPR) repeat protein